MSLNDVSVVCLCVDVCPGMWSISVFYLWIHLLMSLTDVSVVCLCVDVCPGMWSISVFHQWIHLLMSLTHLSVTIPQVQVWTFCQIHPHTVSLTIWLIDLVDSRQPEFKIWHLLSLRWLLVCVFSGVCLFVLVLFCFILFFIFRVEVFFLHPRFI